MKYKMHDQHTIPFTILACVILTDCEQLKLDSFIARAIAIIVLVFMSMLLTRTIDLICQMSYVCTCDIFFSSILDRRWFISFQLCACMLVYNVCVNAAANVFCFFFT